MDDIGFGDVYALLESLPDIDIQTPVQNWFEFLTEYSGKTFTKSGPHLTTLLIAVLKPIIKIVASKNNTLIYIITDKCKINAVLYSVFLRDQKYTRCNYAIDHEKGHLTISDVVSANINEFMYRDTVFSVIDKNPINRVNLFINFRSELVKDPNIKLIDPILTHILQVFAMGNVKMYNYLMDWFATIIQTDNKNLCIPVIYGKQGAGKDIIFDFIWDKVIGYENVVEHNDIICHKQCRNKILTVLHEVRVHKGNYIYVEHKLDDFRKNNNYIIISENDTPVCSNNIFSLFKCSNKYDDDNKYFAYLSGLINGDGSGMIANTLFTFLYLRKIQQDVTKPLEGPCKVLLSDLLDFGNTLPIKSQITSYEIEKTGHKQKGHSAVSIRWLKSLGKNIRHAENGGEFKIPNTRYRADGYDPNTNTVYEFHGTYWHGHPKFHKPEDIHPVSGHTFGDLYQKTLMRENLIRSLGYNLVVMWEHEFEED